MKNVLLAILLTLCMSSCFSSYPYELEDSLQEYEQDAWMGSAINVFDVKITDSEKQDDGSYECKFTFKLRVTNAYGKKIYYDYRGSATRTGIEYTINYTRMQ